MQAKRTFVEVCLPFALQSLIYGVTPHNRKRKEDSFRFLSKAFLHPKN